MPEWGICVSSTFLQTRDQGQIRHRHRGSSGIRTDPMLHLDTCCMMRLAFVRLARKSHNLCMRLAIVDHTESQAGRQAEPAHQMLNSSPPAIVAALMRGIAHAATGPLGLETSKGSLSPRGTHQSTGVAGA